MSRSVVQNSGLSQHGHSGTHGPHVMMAYGPYYATLQLAHGPHVYSPHVIAYGLCCATLQPIGLGHPCQMVFLLLSFTLEN